MAESRIDTVIFDIGGVLVKENGKHFIKERYGVLNDEGEASAWQLYKRGRCSEGYYWRKSLEGTSLADSWLSIAEEVRRDYASVKPSPLHQILPVLRENGYRVGILSNHTKEWVKPVIDSLDLMDLCDPVVISADVGCAKPESEIFEIVLRRANRLDRPQKCVFIDDKFENYVAALRSGMLGIEHKSFDDTISRLYSLGVRL